MFVLALGIVLFAAVHLLPAVPAAKERVKALTGEKAYGALFGAASVIALLLIVWGWRISDFVPVYEPSSWGRHANFGLTFFAFLCLGIFLFRGRLRQWLRFPMGLAVLLWGTGHLLANGDARSLILFGGLIAYGLLHIGVGLAQGSRPSPEVHKGHDLLSLVMGAAFYAAMTQLHPVLIGVPVLSL